MTILVATLSRASTKRIVVLGSLLAIAFFVMFYLVLSQAVYEVDLGVYRDGAAAAWSHSDLYSLRFAPSGLPFTYPPFAVVLFTPLSWLPMSFVQLMWTLGCIGAVIGLAVVCVRRYLVPTTNLYKVAVIATIALALGADPTRVGTLAGQINALLALLVVLDLNRLTWRIPQGVLIGAAASVKLIPLFLIVYLVVTRRFKAAGYAAAAFVVCSGVGALLLPNLSNAYWDGYFWDSARIGGIEYISNQSVHGALVRLLDGTSGAAMPWLIAALVITVGSLVVCARLFDQLLRVADSIALVAMVLVSPVSWSPHWIFVLPAILVAFRLAWSARSHVLFVIASTAALVFAIGPIWFVPHNRYVEYRHAVWQMAVGNSYLLCGIALIAGLAIIGIRRTRTPIQLTQLRIALTRRVKSSSVL